MGAESRSATSARDLEAINRASQEGSLNIAAAPSPVGTESGLWTAVEALTERLARKASEATLSGFWTVDDYDSLVDGTLMRLRQALTAAVPAPVGEGDGLEEVLVAAADGVEYDEGPARIEGTPEEFADAIRAAGWHR
jgi:hypothetical protein